MAHALQLPGADPLFETHPKLTARLGTYSYLIERRTEDTIYSVSDGNETISVPIRWVFGVGSQTFVLEHESKLYESFVSYYPSIDGLDTTMGDQRVHPTTLLQAMGRELSAQEAQSCLACHTTSAVVKNELHLGSLKPGVTCEHCHIGALNHLEAISSGKLESVPPKLEHLSAEDLSNFCGQCHRSWETVVKGHLFGQINVRFQPYRLANSKCFDGTDRRISCVACHDPHREVVREPASYDSKCLACHGSANFIPASHQAPSAKSCPVAASGCVNCHMPKVSLPGGHQVFTDHDIRVVRANEQYPN